MKPGDIVKVRLKGSPHVTQVGIVIREPKKMYMAGDVLEVMVGGNIQYIKKEHVELIKKGAT
jgi:hypothetical protein